MRIVITGASDGIGLAGARRLAAAGHEVIVVGRNKQKTERVAAELNAKYHLADYSDLSSVAALANELRAYDKIDVLCNNVGGILNERKLTKDGFEQIFQINVLGGFLLTRLLLDKLIADQTKVIQTSSIASNLYGKKMDVNDLNSEKEYTPVKAYGNAKLCVSLLTSEFQKRYGEKGIKSVAFEPWIARSNFASDSFWGFRVAFHSPLKYLFTIPPKRSAKRLVYLATHNDYELGKTYSCKRPYKIKYKHPEVQSALFDACVKFTDKFVPHDF